MSTCLDLEDTIPFILRIKRARDVSRRDGGYHIVYTGGEKYGMFSGSRAGRPSQQCQSKLCQTSSSSEQLRLSLSKGATLFHCCYYYSSSVGGCQRNV
jgi:hypothetical protein